jgi:hypothetical protein
MPFCYPEHMCLCPSALAFLRCSVLVLMQPLIELGGSVRLADLER